MFEARTLRLADGGKWSQINRPAGGRSVRKLAVDMPENVPHDFFPLSDVDFSNAFLKVGFVQRLNLREDESAFHLKPVFVGLCVQALFYVAPGAGIFSLLAGKEDRAI